MKDLTFGIGDKMDWFILTFFDGGEWALWGRTYLQHIAMITITAEALGIDFDEQESD